MVFRIYFLDVIRKKYAQFSGRARRSEYWFFMLFKWAIILTLVQLSELAEQGTLAFTALAGMSVLFFIALIIPSLAVSVRRLHDTGNSGWIFLLGMIPLLGGLILLIFYFLDSNSGTNKYGRDPHEIVEDITDHLIS